MLNEHGLVKNVESVRDNVNANKSNNNDTFFGQQDGKKLGPSDD